MQEETRKSHPSYAVVRFSHRHGGNHTFFGSKTTASSYIGLTISRAYEYRSLSENSYMDAGGIIELRLSPNQFAELLTSMNCGVGVPATIESLNGKYVEAPPVESEVDVFMDEVEERGKEALDSLQDLEKVVATFKLTKKEQAEFRSAMCKVKNEVVHNLPFVIQQAKNAISKAVVEAKGVIDSFWTGIIPRLGVKSLENKENIVQLIESDKK